MTCIPVCEPTRSTATQPAESISNSISNSISISSITKAEMERIPGMPSMETGWEKMKRRAAEEPLVPLGCLLTAGVLAAGLRSFGKAADQRTQQRFMRARVVAQGATVVAASLGSILALKKKE